MGNPRPLLTLFIALGILALLAAIALPNFICEPCTSPKNACINNLRQIDAAIQRWALENNKTNWDAPTWPDLKKYLSLSGYEVPKCPAGGKYKLGRVIDPPTCSYPGHVLH